MLIPVGHDQDTVRRLPWVTFTLMGLCVVAFLLTLVSLQSSVGRAKGILNEIAEYYMSHPETELEPEIEEYLFGYISNFQGERDAFKEALKEGARGFGFVGEGEDRSAGPTVEEQQAQLDRLQARFHDAIESSPYFEWGLVPSDQTIHGYITHQFMHGGWLHLIFNMLFLYLAGPYLEDVWGRPLFATFYLGAGVFAALIYVLKYPDLDGPLVGASGAIAGLMGAFLVRYGKTKIKMMFFFWFRPHFFDAPAWLLLPLWMLREVFYGQAVDVAGGQGTGVAHWAHVAGFVFGVGVAVGVRQFKVEERFVDSALEAKIDKHENLVLEEAFEARQSGALDQAETVLVEQLRAVPGDFDAAMAYWDVRRDLGDILPAVPFVLRVFRDAMRKGQHDLVEPRWAEVVEMAPEGSVDPALAARAAESLGSKLTDGELRATIEAGAASVDSTTPSGLLIRLARTGAAVGAPSVHRLVEQALEAPDVPDEVREELEALPASAAPPAPTESAPPPPPVTGAGPIDGPVVEAEGDSPDPDPSVVAPEDHELEIMEVRPSAWDNGILTISVGGKPRPMNMAQVQAMAVGGITEPGKAPYVLVDLMIDAPWSRRVKLRIVRFRSTAFDPTAVVSGPDAMASFKKLLSEILSFSGAAPLPSHTAAVGDPFQRYPSEVAYEREVLGVTSA